MKKLIWISASGGLVGGMGSSWLAPKLIAWYFNPPVEMAINCKSPIEWALRKLQWAQLGGSISGAIVFLILYLLFWKRKEELTPLS